MTERHFSTPVAPSVLICAKPIVDNSNSTTGNACVDTNDRIRRIIMPRLGLSRLYWASIRAYWAGAVEMELTESRQPGEAWARHRGARAGVFGEAPRRFLRRAHRSPANQPKCLLLA